MNAQKDEPFIKEQSIDAAIGLGISTPYDDVDIFGSGFYLQGEYVLTHSNWLDFRPYAGLILTRQNPDQTLPKEFETTTNAFLIGGKVRLTAPIPYFAPYVEIGAGLSVGSFKTITPFSNYDESGVIPHIPFSIGAELGKRHNIGIEFTYYFHSAVEQLAGAAAIGLNIPLN
jgi:hypothetical protein